MLYHAVIIHFDAVDEILNRDRSSKSYLAKIQCPRQADRVERKWKEWVLLKPASE